MLGDQHGIYISYFLKRSSLHKCHGVGAQAGFDSLKALAWFPDSISRGTFPKYQQSVALILMFTILLDLSFVPACCSFLLVGNAL